MKRRPYGYDTVNAKAVVNEAEAAVIRKICGNYLSGMSFVSAAADAGLRLKHSSVKQMIQNRRYLGDDYYPAILDEETFKKIEAERLRRKGKRGGVHRKPMPKGIVYTAFSVPRIPVKYDDPIRQAEFAYSLIENKEAE